MLSSLLFVILGAPPVVTDDAAEAKHLANQRQVTFGLPRAGEGYFSPKGDWIVYQAYPIGYPHLELTLTDAQDQVVVQSPPNGIPGAVAANLVPTGALGVDAGPLAGLDIYSVVVDGVTVDNLAFGALDASGVAGFYGINLGTGQATLLDLFEDRVVDIALPVGQN